MARSRWPSVEDRLWSRVEKTDGCWIWNGHTCGGYGRMLGTRGRDEPAHRIAYELLIGPVPEGLELDHLCRNRACVNPAHLEPVTRRENALRGIGIQAVNAAKTHCPQGHPLAGENLKVSKLGQRTCRICQRGHGRAAKARKKARMESEGDPDAQMD